MMRLFVVLVLVLHCKGEQEELPNLESLINDPDALFKLEKRLGNLLADLESDIEVDSPPTEPVGCNALRGVLNNDCEFRAKNSSIIKTRESLERKAKFLEDMSNVSCPRECTARCCDHEECDTAIFQNKEVHNCYLFKCGSPSRCVFAEHADYWMSSSKDVHSTHSLAPGGATVTHENELQNLGTDQRPDTTVQPTTEKPTTTAKPGKRCRDEEFECERIQPGVAARQCVYKTFVCDGSQDCEDGSDELNCDDKDKPAYLDPELIGNLYSNSLYNLPYSGQTDSQYPYGFPIPGLTNRQPGGMLSANQIYQNQLQSPGGTGNGYYVPVQGQGQAVNLPQAESQLSGRWPFLDKPVNVGSQVYQNNLPYQNGQQSGYIPQQQQAQTGYIPVVQQPVQPKQQVVTNLQPVQQPTGNTQQNVASVVQAPVAPQVKVPVQVQVTKPPVDKDLPAQIPVAPVSSDQRQGAGINHKHTDITDKLNKDVPVADRPAYLDDSYSDYLDEHAIKSAHRNEGTGTSASKSQTINSDHLDLQEEKNYGRYDSDDFADDTYHRHSSEEDDLDQRPFKPLNPTKPKHPVQSAPESDHQSDTGKSHSEGFPDYSWIGYDSDSPRINSKKGPTHIDNNNEARKTTKKPATSVSHTKTVPVKQETHKAATDDTEKPRNRVNDDRGEYQNSRYPDKYRSRYDDFDRPNNNRWPSYNRYPDQYPSNNRHRPSHGSRYPFYESGYPRGRDRNPNPNPYPVWDPLKSEYYYPDDYEEKDFENVPDVASMGTGGHMDYLNTKTDNRVADSRPHNTDTKVTDDAVDTHTSRPVLTEAPQMPAVVTQAPSVTKKIMMVTTPKPHPAKPEEPVIQQHTDNSVEESQTSDISKSTDTDTSKTADTKSSDQNSKSVNTTKSETDSDGSGKFQFLNVEAVEVDSYTDSSQAPIVALSLGLAITVILLIFVGCRLRNVKRRLRKGRALHSNEADYLINGMYL